MLQHLAGRTFGPVAFVAGADRVAMFVAATGDEPVTDTAPPGIAGAALFAVAPQLLADRAVAGQSVIHGEQTFTWHKPTPVGTELAVSGRVGKVRERGGVYYVGFGMEVTSKSELLIDGSSTFLISGHNPDTVAGRAAEEVEPPATIGSLLDPPGRHRLPEVGHPLPSLARSASRSDLVRYAGASGDWNPIHWDHASAVDAGLPGVVCHGLLQSAWICQSVGRVAGGLRSARFRFRKPLRPAVPVEVTGRRSGDDTFEMVLGSGDTTTVAAVLVARV